MIISILVVIIVLFSLTALIILHELGHFLLAKKFGVKVEEFGLFLPPRVWGKQIGETIYSINLLPLGGFVKLLGEEGLPSDGGADPRNFNSKPVWQRAWIIAGGVISFWIIAFLILTFVFIIGSVSQVDDSEVVANPQVEIVMISPNSPASAAGLKSGDFVKSVRLENNLAKPVTTDTVFSVQNFTSAHEGEPVAFEILRGGQTIDLTITPRVNPPSGDGPVGIALTRIGKKTYPLWQAPWEAAKATWNDTANVFISWGTLIGSLVQHKGLPAGATLSGPIGIFGIMDQAAYRGVAYYLQLVALLTVYLAVFNALPIPALDGGKLMFLAIEAVSRKPVPSKIEQPITAVCFFLLLALVILVSIGDIRRFF